MPWRLMFPVLLVACLILVARISDRHGWQLDVTAQRSHTLSGVATQALDALVEPLALIAFVPDYAVARAELRRLLAPYLAHPSRPSLSFIDPVEEPALARRHNVARHGELHLRSGQRHEVVEVPHATAIDAALNRMALRGERWIVSLTGHGEAEIDGSPGGMSRMAGHTERLGYRILSLDPTHLDSLPDNTAVLLIAGPQAPYSPHVAALIERFVDVGGSLLWLSGDGLSGWAQTLFGIDLLPGVVVDAAAARQGLDRPDNAIVSAYPAMLLPQPPLQHSVLLQARGLQVATPPGWETVARLESSPASWNETGDLRGQVAREAALGEQAGPIAVGIALQRHHGDSRQRIAVLGSHHFVTNDQIGQAGNLGLALGLLRWLSDNRELALPEPARDLDIHWSPQLAGLLAIGLMGLLPAVYLALGLWSRHRRRRA